MTSLHNLDLGGEEIQEQIRNLARTIREENPGIEDEVLLTSIKWYLLNNVVVDELPQIDTSKYYKAWNHSLYKKIKRTRGEQFTSLPSKAEFIDYFNYNSYLQAKYNDKRHDYVYHYIQRYIDVGIRRLGILQFWLTHKINSKRCRGHVMVSCLNNPNLADQIYAIWGAESTKETQDKSDKKTQEIKMILGIA